MPHVRIGTRSSPMALHQAEQVATALEALDSTVSTELVKITTSGDQWMG
ncbi:MAG: hydroxymethylbilane synthase, partial [Pseudonocardiales bacterium]|nr:hydroxymethylbilane synthase [Pseudonocardiales bacterium]